MRKILCLLLILNSFILLPDLHAQSIREKAGKKLLQGDSTVEKLQKLQDSLEASLQQKEPVEIRNFQNDGLLQLYKEQEKRRKKEKTMAFIRIGIGLFLLVVLIFGLKRRVKKSPRV